VSQNFISKKISAGLIILAINLILVTSISAQRLTDWSKGNHNHTKKGFMNGNLIETVYYNFGEVADWENEASRSGVWPKGTNPAQTYLDGVAIIVQAEAKDPFGNLIHPLESNYYEFTRVDPATRVTYGWWPLPNYSNALSNNPARSDDPSTWPESWPDRLSEYDGKWNGLINPAKQNADVETYFVFDDNEDREYILKNSFYPDADDTTRGGLGMQVRARGFQWSQVLAEDVIFWFYEITNMSTTDYDKVLFAQYVDWGVGGHDNSSNNAGDYDELLDMSFAWSTVPYGSPGHWSPVGLAAYAFLESPGISTDYKDNDTDGLTDEQRDNGAGVFIERPEDDPFLINVQNDTVLFREFYGYGWQPHWTGDENGDWRTFTDVNDNGFWDEGEPLNDDVGTDGIGNFDEGYPGPDADGTEGNGRPDQGEPSFGVLDKDESDQLGLTGFLIFPVHRYELTNDEENWQVLSSLPSPHGQVLENVNLANYFSSYLFHLNGRNTYGRETGETERFSMALIFGIDSDDLFRRKRTVQQIYNANYNFAKPPEKPMIKAIAGNKRVTLYWDDRSEKTFDAFYQKYNFEGYRIYRSTEPNFLENKVITDAYGKSTYRKPIVQFDLADGVRGLHPIDVNGAMFNLGEDTGLKHTYIDSNLQNGQTYYYAVVAYDQGFTTTTVEGQFIGIPPSETTSIIKVDIYGDYKTDINTAVVTPAAPAAGYIPPEIINMPHTGPGTGGIFINVLDPDTVKDDHTYRIEFENNTPFHNAPKPLYSLINYTLGDTLINREVLSESEIQTNVIDGFAIDIFNDQIVTMDLEETGWLPGNTTYRTEAGFDPRFGAAYQAKRVDYPADFDISFVGKGIGDTSLPATNFSQPIPSDIIIKNLTEDIDHVQFIFRDENNDSLFNLNDAIFIVSGDSAGKQATSYRDWRVTWSVSLFKDTTIADIDQRPPEVGDVFHLVTKKPFRTGEYFEFITNSPRLNKDKAKTDLDEIAVVPNPYVGAASWEPITNDVGRGERRVFFTNLPAQCTIRIYTISGHLVQIIEHNTSTANGQEPWNLVSKDGMNVAYGIYIFHVDAPGIGEKIGRFALIK
jgi:hypothetical protein